MAGQNIVRRLNATRRGVPASAAGGTVSVPRAGLGLGALLGAYSIPGFGEQRARNQQEVLRAAQGPLNELRYIGGAFSRGQIPYFGPRVGAIPPRERSGESYRDAELRLSAAARAAAGPSAGGGIGGGNAASYIPSPVSGGTSGGGSPAAERAYQAEASRVAQMAAQNPDLQRYEAARQAAVAPGATPEQVQSAEDLGMRIWAEKYGKTLAPKVKPGQAGYDVIQGVLNTGKMGAPLDLPFNPSSVLSTEPVPASAEYGATAPVALPPEAALAANAFSNVQPGMFQRYRDQSALEVSPLYDSTISPLGATPPFGALNYGGAVQPIGGNVVDEAFRGDKARQLAEMFKNAVLTSNR